MSSGLPYADALKLARKAAPLLDITVADFLRRLTVLEWSRAAAQHYADIRAKLESAGTPIGNMDLMIAAHARSAGAVLVTNNEKHFRRVDGLKVEGFWRAHQVPVSGCRENPAHLKVLEDWMHSYEPEKLFDASGALVGELQALAPTGERRMGANPHANGGLLKKELKLPDFRGFALEVPQPGGLRHWARGPSRSPDTSEEQTEAMTLSRLAITALSRTDNRMPLLRHGAKSTLCVVSPRPSH